MQEREMTKKDKAKEKRLKKKYDDSDMKKSMKKQYGDDWKNVYYATIRKKAMENKIDEALKYEYMVLDQDGRVMGMSTNYRDAEQNARGDNLLGITGRVVKLRRPMSQGRGDRLMGQLPADNLGEGYYEMPDIDRSRYTEMPGMEGPFQTRAGKVVYYDPKEGAYYDRDTDMYMTYDEFKALDEGRKKNKNPMGPQGIMPGDRVEHEGDMYEVVAVDGDILTVNNLQNGNRTQFRMDDVTRLSGMDAMTDQDKDNLDAMFKRLKKVGSGSLKHVATEGEAGDHDRMYKVVHAKKGMMDIKAKTSYEAAKKFAKEKGLKSTAGVDTHLYPLEEGHSPHKKGTKKYKAHMAAMHANSAEPKGKMIEAKKTKTVTLEDMRTALQLDEDTTPIDIVSEYVKTTLDETFDTWPKVRKQVDYILAKVNDTTALSGDEVFDKVFRENLQSQLDEQIIVSENIDKLRDIVKNRSAMTVKFEDGTMKVDMTTASIFVQAFDRMKERNQEKISEMMRTKKGFLRVLDFIYGAMK